MPSILPRKSPANAEQDQIVAKRKLMWESWIDECVGMEEACIEAKLANLPSLVARDV